MIMFHVNLPGCTYKWCIFSGNFTDPITIDPKKPQRTGTSLELSQHQVPRTKLTLPTGEAGETAPQEGERHGNHGRGAN